MSQPQEKKNTCRNSSPIISHTLAAPGLIWAFTESNFSTFVVPNSAFGLLGALAARFLADGSAPPSAAGVLARAPLVVLFNWHNVLNFDLANQRSPASVEEDRLNKPWRPIVTGRITADQTRGLMLLTIPSALLFNYALGVWRQGVFILIITWLYNDIRGGDGVLRDLLISIAYGLFNSASLEVALGDRSSINDRGIIWTAMVSGVILTTMQIQDLKDQAGDRTRGRKTAALLMGDMVSRVSIVAFVCAWSLLCPCFWDTGLVGYAISSWPAAVIALRLMLWQSPKDDAGSWRWWCFWTCTLYLQPLLRVSMST